MQVLALLQNSVAHKQLKYKSIPHLNKQNMTRLIRIIWKEENCRTHKGLFLTNIKAWHRWKNLNEY